MCRACRKRSVYSMCNALCTACVMHVAKGGSLSHVDTSLSLSHHKTPPFFLLLCRACVDGVVIFLTEFFLWVFNCLVAFPCFCNTLLLYICICQGAQSKLSIDTWLNKGQHIWEKVVVPVEPSIPLVSPQQDSSACNTASSSSPPAPRRRFGSGDKK